MMCSVESPFKTKKSNVVSKLLSNIPKDASLVQSFRYNIMDDHIKLKVVTPKTKVVDPKMMLDYVNFNSLQVVGQSNKKKFDEL